MILKRLFCAISLVVILSTGPLHADDLKSIGNTEFANLHNLIKPQRGESRWMEIDWYPSVWEARQRAAAEGKPMFLMAGSGGAPVAGC